MRVGADLGGARRVCLAGVTLAAIATAAPPTRAQPADAGFLAPRGRTDADAAIDPDLARLADGHAERKNYQPSGLADRYGRGQVLIRAPIGIVHRLVLDYGHYKEFTAGKFHTSRVIAKAQAGTDVYFQLSVLDGMITLWQVFRFQEVKPLARGWAIVEGWYVKGNIGRGNAAWTLHAIDDERTLVTFDLLILPNIPLPQSLLDDGLRNAAGEAVEAIRDRAEEAARPAPL
jgi:hypothetical protein